jgi:YD repeat-containing protein
MMKNLLKCILLVICTLPVSAQSDKNFVLSKTFKQAGDNSFGKVSIQIQYLDGLGRPIQNQSVGQSSSGTDMIEPIEYDAYGRRVYNYLPYAGGGSGAFQPIAVSNQATFYATNVPLLDAATTVRPYQITIYESSPEARPVITREPGDNSLTSLINYTSNITNEVKKYTYTANTDITQTISPTVGYYDAGKLFRKEIIDDNQKTTVEFTDMKGRLICKINGTFPTYYVYDDFGLLRAVLQPRFQEPDGTAEKFAFLYDYDERGRLITKKLPGAGKVDFVYDNFDRPVMSQDANQLQRGGGMWSFMKYDALNRKIMSGEHNLGSGFTRAALQTSFNASAAHHEDRDSSVPGYTFGQTLPVVTEADILSATYYDKYYFQGVQPFATPTGITIGTSTTAVNSLQTGSRTRMLNDGKQWMVATNYYDSELRTIQSVRQLYDFDAAAIERVSNKYKYDLAQVIDQQKTEQTFSVSPPARLPIHT